MHQLRELSDKIDAFGGIDAAAAWYATTPLVRVKYPDKAAAINYAKCTIRSLLKPDEPHNQVARDQLALLMRDLGKPQGEETVRVVSSVVEVEAAPVSQVVQAPVNAGSNITQSETGIVRVVDGIPFTLPALDRSGAEAARVTLTDLAKALGYSDRQRLKELAARHVQELAEFGETFTVSVSVRQGFTTRQIDEPTYSPDQAAYLALSSETEQGRACRVRILKAYKALLAMFEQVVNQPPAFDVNAIAGVIGAAVVGAMAPLLERLLGPKPAPQNDPAPPVATTQAPRRAQEPKPTRQERFRFPVNRRMGLVKKIKAQIPADVEDYSKTIRTLWHGLYAEMERHGVSVLASVADYQLLHGEQIDYLDWIEQNGHLELAIRCAFALWPERKTAA